jgi:hypothetical protein
MSPIPWDGGLLLINSQFSFWSGIYVQGLMFARQMLYHLRHVSNPFCVGYLLYSVLLYAVASLDGDPLLCDSPLSKDHRYYHYSRSLGNLCPITILLIAVSHIARITVLSHHGWHILYTIFLLVWFGLFFSYTVV